MRRRSLLLLGVLLAARWCAAEPRCEINVNVSLTPEGRKVAPPSRAQPAFYFPVIGGWREEGSLVAGEKKPAPQPIAHLLATALAAQGYLVVSPAHPEAQLLLVFFWGYMNPQINEFGSDPDNPQTVFFNQNEMLALVGGQKLGMLDMSFEREAVMQGAQDDRYFVIVAAYDGGAARQKKKVLLWTARMSTPSTGVTIDEVLPAMISSGGPHFGRETLRPAWVAAPLARQGKVEVGTPTVVPDAPPAAPDTSAAAPDAAAPGKTRPDARGK